MSATQNQISTTGLLDLSKRSKPAATDPLFLPVKAPTAPGTADNHELVVMSPFTAYGIHWNGPDGTKRSQCQGEDCPLCEAGHVPQPFYAAVALDRLAPRYVIAQISEAVLQHIADAADAYVQWLTTTGQAQQLDVFESTDPWQPAFHIKASRTPSGPRYQVAAAPVKWDRRYDAVGQISFASYREMPPGRRWTSWAEEQTALPLRRGLPDFTGFDVLPLIFPPRADDDEWLADVDD
jgi:hypothetical protein